jgi:hypothetical protein
LLTLVALVGALLAAPVPGLRGGGSPFGAMAAPGQPTADEQRFQNVDYLGADAAAALALEFPVLVPASVPAPFGGEPAVQGGGGFYSLYWMVSGGAPTFLQITGEVGGQLPAGSPYDLNVQLSVNANVQGNDAIHDVTDVYDTVWWISGGVLYTVQSRNMATDSLSLANSLIAFSAPAPEPEPAAPEAQEPDPDSAEPPAEEAETPQGDVTPEEVAESTATAEDGSTGSEVESAAAPTESAEDESVEGQPATPEASDEAEDVSISLEAEIGDEPAVPADVDGDGGSVDSDGTGGAPPPVFGGDGTGGTRDIVVPDGND